MKSRFRFWSRSGTGVAETFLRVSGSGFSVHLWPMGAIPLRPEHRFHLETVFVSPKTVSVCSRNTYFGKSEGIMLQWRICFIFFKSFSYFISIIIRSFVLVSDYSLPWLRMLFAVHLARSRRIRNSDGKFFCLLGYVCSLSCTLCDHGKSEITRKLENVDFPGKLTNI